MLNLLKSRNSIWGIIVLTLIPTMVIALTLMMVPASTVAGESSSAHGAITRAKFIAKIVDYFGWPHPSEYNDIWEDYAVEDGLINYTFNDVKFSDQYGKEIETAYAEGIIGPDANGNFRPNDTISREDAAVIIVKAWKLPASDTPTAYQDDKNISDAAKGSVYELVALGCMDGRTKKTFVPRADIKEIEVESIMNALEDTVVAPVYALPRQGYEAPRRYVKLYCADPDATIIYTKDGSDPLTSSTAKVWDVAVNGYINEMLRGSPPPERRDVVYKAYSMKDGLITSRVQTFTWHLYRPKTAPYESKLILQGTATSPTVYEIWNDADSVRAMMWYIEGPESGILFDNGGVSTPNLKSYIDQNLATKPYINIVGHSHPDHDAQIGNFISAGIPTYSDMRGWSSLTSLVSDTYKPLLQNIDWGDTFDLGGGIVFDVYALPGHHDGLLMLNDKKNGLVFATDIYGCTRAGSADNVDVSGVKVDMLLSMAEQVHAQYLKNGGKVDMVFTGHDETPLKGSHLNLFEATLQQVIDKGEAGCSPTLRGGNDAPNTRTTIIGDMWYDNTNWLALKLAGKMGDSTEYLTHNTQFNYNAGGYTKYSVLSNIVFTGGDLVGVDLSWGNPISFSWLGSTISVPRTLYNMFDPWTYNYTVKVAAGTSSITVVPTTMSTQVKSIKLNGQEIENKSVNNVQVSGGSTFTITVVAPDGVTTSTYTFTVQAS